MPKHLLCILLLVIVGLGLGSTQTHAQGEYTNWYFGNKAGVTFNGPTPVALTNSPNSFLYGTACMSDASGRFLFASNGAQVWDRNWQPMPGRITPHDLVGFSSRQVLAVRQPGSTSRYYVFRSSNQFSTGQYPITSQTPVYMPYVVVDMQARGGLGAIAVNDSLRLPDWTLHLTAPYFYPNTNFAAVRHANGHDVWVIVQTDEGQVVSYLLSAAGLATQPVVSLSPRSISTVSNGILKASGDGKTLVSITYFGDRNQAYTTIEVARFDPATGQVTSFYTLPDRYRGRITTISSNQWSTYYVRVTGLELSPDGSKLYTDTVGGRTIMQYNLLAGSPQQVSNSKVNLPLTGSIGFNNGDLQLGPDGKIYMSMGSTWLGRIERPNVPGGAAGFTAQAVNLGVERISSSTLPYATNDLNLPPVSITGAGSIAASEGCAGEPLPFVSSLSPFVTAAAYAWDFGDPASDSRNTAAGQAPTHVYAQSGQYTVTLRVTATDGRQFTTTQRVQVAPLPEVDLGPDLLLCHGESQLLRAGAQLAGSTYRWQDGSTQATLRADTAGVYRLTVTSPSGCITTDEVTITATDCADLPNVITPNGDQANEYFVLRGLMATEWRCQIFTRWGQRIFEAPSYANNWNAAGQPAGTYYYLLTNPATGQQYKGWVQVIR